MIKAEKLIVLASQRPSSIFFGRNTNCERFSGLSKLSDLALESLPRSVSCSDRKGEPGFRDGPLVFLRTFVFLLNFHIALLTIVNALGGIAKQLKSKRQFASREIRSRRNCLVDQGLKVRTPSRKGAHLFESFENWVFRPSSATAVQEPEHKVMCATQAGQLFFNPVLLPASCGKSHLPCHIPRCNNDAQAGNRGADYWLPLFDSAGQSNKRDRQHSGKHQKRHRQKVVTLLHLIKVPPMRSFVEGVAT
ncbi:hypothetical protein ACVJDU_006342 [Bradyrhizobium diazoefficiens]